MVGERRERRGIGNPVVNRMHAAEQPRGMQQSVLPVEPGVVARHAEHDRDHQIWPATLADGEVHLRSLVVDELIEQQRGEARARRVGHRPANFVTDLAERRKHVLNPIEQRLATEADVQDPIQTAGHCQIAKTESDTVPDIRADCRREEIVDSHSPCPPSAEVERLAAQHHVEFPGKADLVD